MKMVSIVLPVKNAEKYLSAALDSILNQSHTCFELLIFNDDSSDSTLEIINGYKDSRIRVYSGKDGYIANLNTGFEIANGDYIARMDADDIMSPERLEIQLEIMETFDIDICSSSIYVFGAVDTPYLAQHGLKGIINKPLELLSQVNFVAHPAVMLRRDFLKKHNLKYLNYPYAEDYKLWSEIAKKGGKFYIVGEPLVAYRISPNQVSRLHAAEMQIQSLKISREIIDFINTNHQM